MLMYHHDLHTIGLYFIAFGHHENPSVVISFAIQSLLVSEILLEAAFSVMAAANLHISCQLHI